MDSLYLLLPMSMLLVLALIGLFAWALDAGQFDDLEREGARLLEEDEALARQAPRDATPDPAALDFRQGPPAEAPEESTA